MSFSVKLSSFDEVEQKLESIQKKIDELKSKEILFSDLFDNSFMTRHSNYSSFNAMLEAGGFKVSSREDLAAIPDHKLDAHISKTTDFDSWEDMQHSAIEQYIKHTFF